MSIEELLAGDGWWDIRIQLQDLSTGLYSVALHDPETWIKVGPYQLVFASAQEAFAWLQDVADIDTAVWTDEHLSRGEHVQGRAAAPQWRGILSTLEHCAHMPRAIKERAPEPAPGVAPQRSEWDADEGWTRLTEFVAALVALTDDVVVVAANTDHHSDGDVYVQLCREDDGALTLEAVSSAFLRPALPADAIDVLHEMGWEDPRDDGLPNFTRFLEAGSTAPGDVAAFLVATLRDAYSVQPDDRFQFAPEPLVESLLRGDFGPRFKLDPNMPEGREARRYMGIRFPSDLA